MVSMHAPRHPPAAMCGMAQHSASRFASRQGWRRGRQVSSPAVRDSWCTRAGEERGQVGGHAAPEARLPGRCVRCRVCRCVQSQAGLCMLLLLLLPACLPAAPAALSRIRPARLAGQRSCLILLGPRQAACGQAPSWLLSGWGGWCAGLARPLPGGPWAQIALPMGPSAQGPDFGAQGAPSPGLSHASADSSWCRLRAGGGLCGRSVHGRRRAWHAGCGQGRCLSRPSAAAGRCFCCHCGRRAAGCCIRNPCAQRRAGQQRGRCGWGTPCAARAVCTAQLPAARSWVGQRWPSCSCAANTAVRPLQLDSHAAGTPDAGRARLWHCPHSFMHGSAPELVCQLRMRPRPPCRTAQPQSACAGQPPSSTPEAQSKAHRRGRSGRPEIEPAAGAQHGAAQHAAQGQQAQQDQDDLLLRQPGQASQQVERGFSWKVGHTGSLAVPHM